LWERERLGNHPEQQSERSFAIEFQGPGVQAYAFTFA
jgi:hypothetical protein